MSRRVALALAMAVAAASAHAQSTDDYLKRIDANRDGRVSADEYVAWMSYGFDAMAVSYTHLTLPTKRIV